VQGKGHDLAERVRLGVERGWAVKLTALGAARPYARALLEIAVEQGTAARVRQDLHRATIDLEGSRDLCRVLTHPAVLPGRKEKIVAAVWPEGALDPLVMRLLAMLVRRDRVLLLPEIGRIYTEAWNTQRGVVSAQATSAMPLSPQQRTGVERAIVETTGLTADLQTAVDPALVGGLVLRMGGKTYDGSVRGRLRRLRQQLLGPSGA
jgi:F-type H+-transporting ATPase subunit delta